ncbi:MAG: hypothetical protein JWP01_2053 [Myxococcales bacterium]|nr:hypothetical protein [Myxococcales bacterium]
MAARAIGSAAGNQNCHSAGLVRFSNMPSPSLWLVLSVALSACGPHHAAQPSRPPAEFCASVIAGDLEPAGHSAHGALIEAEADQLSDASEPLAAWLRTQPCVTSVTVPAEVIETEPGIREIVFELKPDASGSIRRCVADLRLAPGGRVGIHPASHSTSNPDTHCTVVP